MFTLLMWQWNVIYLLFQFFSMEHYDGNIYTKYAVGHQTGEL